MAQNVEPMDIDSSVCDFDNKENTCLSNVLPRTPCTEKGYEELDVSELNMKLRYSLTPANSPMSKSYTANSVDNRNIEIGDPNENGNLTRSLHTLPQDILVKSQKVIPLQTLAADQLDTNRSIFRSLDSTITAGNGNVTVTVSGTNDDENMSFPSSTSSMAHTPEATTPTKDLPKSDDSPILRGLKSVLSMFRPSQSPIPPENDNEAAKEVLSPPIVASPEVTELRQQSAALLASTPLNAQKTKRSSPNRESLVFNDDLERELAWKDETTILFSKEKIPIHKLFFQQPKSEDKPISVITNEANKQDYDEKFDTTVEFMDVSYNDSIKNQTLSEIPVEVINSSDINICIESDSEFVDCETTFSKNDSQISFKSQEIYLPDIIAVKQLNVTNETVSGNSADLSTISTDTARASTNNSLSENIPAILESVVRTEDMNTVHATTTDLNFAHDSTRASINNSLFENVPAPTILESVVKTEDVNAVLATTKDLNLARKSQFNINVDEQEVTQVGSDKLDNDVTKPIETPPVSNQDTVTLGVNPNKNASNISVNNVFALQPDVIDVKKASIPVLGVLSQIPLIADPKVLLFNVSQDSADVQVSKSSVDVVGSLPVDIPLPDDDDDVEKIVSLPSEKPRTNVTEITTGILKENHINSETTPVNIAPIQTENVDFDSLPEVKDLLANIAINKEILKPESNLVVISSEFIANEQNVTKILNETVGLVVTPQDVLPREEMKENAEALLNNEPTKPESFTDCNVANDIAVIPKVEDIFNMKETLDLTETICQGLSVTERKELELETCESACETPSIINKNVLPICDVPIQISGEALMNGNCLVKAINDGIIKTEDAANTNIEIAPLIKMEDFPSHELISDKDSVKDGVVSVVIPVLAPKAVAEEDKIDITLEEERNASIKEIALEIVNKTIELAINPTVGESTTDSPVVQEITSIVMPNVPETDVTNVKKVVVVTAEESPIIAKYISDQIKMDVLINTENARTLDSIPIDDIKSAVPEIISIEENKSNLDLIQVDNVSIVNVKEKTTEVDQPVVITDQVKEISDKTDNIDEEIIASENNSPFVSVTADSELVSETQQIENFEEIEHPFETKSTVAISPPISPKIVLKGYNFNFDEIDDPFATKTKIRQSPPPGTTHNQSFDQLDYSKTEFANIDINKNRRKSQPNRKKQGSVIRKLNSTVCAMNVDQNTPLKVELNVKIEGNKPVLTDLNVTKNSISDDITPIPGLSVEQIEHDVSMTELPEIRNALDDKDMGRKSITITEPEIGNKTFDEIVTKNKPETLNITTEIKNKETFKIEGAVQSESVLNVESISSIENENNNTSSSEHSTYFSTGTSSTELVESKNVFNLPEIDDINWNLTKSKMRQSPPPGLQANEPLATDVHAPDSTVIIDQKEDKNFDPFVTKSMMRQSPPPGCPIANMNKEAFAPEATVLVEQNHDITINITSPKDISVTLDKEPDEKLETGLDEKDSPNNVSNATCSSKATDDKDDTVREINTEDEDTIEGPFLGAEDLNNDDKMSDFDGENVDMMQFSEMPPQENDDNADAGELFIDAEAFEFLLNQNKSNMVADSGKESLFLKFDPLFAKRMSSDGVLAALSKVKKRQSTPKKDVKPNNDATFIQKSPVAGPSNMNATCVLDNNQDETNDELNVTVSKPMMVVNPAVNPVVTPRNKSLTPTRTNRRSLTFTSPAITLIDRLLSMSTNNSLVGLDTTVTEVSREQTEADHALSQLRELLADKEINVYNLRTESKQLKDRLANLESQMKSLEATSEERLKKINELAERLNEKTKINRSMAAVVEEYERTIASLISETEQDRKRHAQERLELMKERDEQTAHLVSMEVSFNDLHSKYEKSKQVILSFKANEEAYKKSIKEFEESLTKMQNNYESLKQHATSKLNHANDELQKMNRAHEAEVLKLNAMMKRKELHITSLEETLLQKTKANEELTAICDELINKVG